jgi:hypothetical protein
MLMTTGTSNRKWSLTNAALYGAALGVPLLMARNMLVDGGLQLTEMLTADIAYYAGGVVGGTILFVIVAAIHNLLVR